MDARVAWVVFRMPASTLPTSRAATSAPWCRYHRELGEEGHELAPKPVADDQDGASLVRRPQTGHRLMAKIDPRNAGVIADLVGDNVGDCARRGADLFESTAAETSAR